MLFPAVIIPDEIGFQDAAAVLLDGVKAYTALHYQAHLTAGDTVVIVDAASSAGSVMLQLAHKWGAKVSSFRKSLDDGRVRIGDMGTCRKLHQT